MLLFRPSHASPQIQSIFKYIRHTVYGIRVYRVRVYGIRKFTCGWEVEFLKVSVSTFPENKLCIKRQIGTNTCVSGEKSAHLSLFCIMRT